MRRVSFKQQLFSQWFQHPLLILTLPEPCLKFKSCKMVHFLVLSIPSKFISWHSIKKKVSSLPTLPVFLLSQWVSVCVCLSFTASSVVTVHRLFKMCCFSSKLLCEKTSLQKMLQLAKHSNLELFVHGIFQKLNEEVRVNYLSLSYQE